MIDRPRISVIVPTFRRPEHLRHCLDGLAAQSYPRERFEVIVVDDGSGDPPLETVARCSGTLDVRLLQPPHSGPASARNAGARQARGDLLAFLDDDCIPDLNWLVELDAAASTTTGAAVGGRILNARPEQLTTEATHLVVEGFAARANADPDDALFCASSNAAFPSAGFRRIGGFDETFTGAAGEDRDLCGRWRTAGGRIVLAAGATVRHDPPPGLGPFFRRHAAYGRAAWRLRRSGGPAVAGGRSLSSAAFSLRLALAPLRSGVSARSAALTLLIALSQVVTWIGFLGEALADGRRENRTIPANDRGGAA